MNKVNVFKNIALGAILGMVVANTIISEDHYRTTLAQSKKIETLNMNVDELLRRAQGGYFMCKEPPSPNPEAPNNKE